jgi:hypothetical protein
MRQVESSCTPTNQPINPCNQSNDSRQRLCHLEASVDDREGVPLDHQKRRAVWHQGGGGLPGAYIWMRYRSTASHQTRQRHRRNPTRPPTPQVIDTSKGILQNVITFPPQGAFIVDSGIAVRGVRGGSTLFRTAVWWIVDCCTLHFRCSVCTRLSSTANNNHRELPAGVHTGRRAPAHHLQVHVCKAEAALPGLQAAAVWAGAGGETGGDAGAALQSTQPVRTHEPPICQPNRHLRAGRLTP